MSADAQSAAFIGQRSMTRPLIKRRHGTLVKPREWRGLSFDGNGFFRNKFNELKVIDCNLSECHFHDCIFLNCNFTDVCFAYSSFQNCVFINISGENNDWTHTEFYNSCICPKTSFYFSTWGLLSRGRTQPEIKVKINPYFAKIKGEMKNASSQSHKAQNQRVRD